MLYAHYGTLYGRKLHAGYRNECFDRTFSLSARTRVEAAVEKKSGDAGL